MSQLFSYPEFDDQGVKVLSRAGEGEGPDDMMMNITVMIRLSAVEPIIRTME